MINYELFWRNFDSERLSYTITKLLLRQLLLRRASYMVTDIVETIQLLWSCCVVAPLLYCHYLARLLS